MSLIVWNPKVHLPFTPGTDSFSNRSQINPFHTRFACLMSILTLYCRARGPSNSSIEFSTKALCDLPKIQLTPVSGAHFPCETDSRSAHRQTPCIMHFNSICSHVFNLTLKYLSQRHIVEHSRHILFHKWRDQFSHSYRAAANLFFPVFLSLCI